MGGADLPGPRFARHEQASPQHIFFCSYAEPVPPWFRNQYGIPLRIRLNFLAETVHMGLQRVRIDAGVIAPNFVK